MTLFIFSYPCFIYLYSLNHYLHYIKHLFILCFSPTKARKVDSVIENIHIIIIFQFVSRERDENAHSILVSFDQALNKFEVLEQASYAWVFNSSSRSNILLQFYSPCEKRLRKITDHHGWESYALNQTTLHSAFIYFMFDK